MEIDRKFFARLLGVDEDQIVRVEGETFTMTMPDGVSSDDLPNLKSLLERRLESRMEALGTVLCGDDDLGLVIRAHIYIEHELHDYIYFAAHNPDQLRFANMEYSDKIHMALVLGLDSNLKAPLTAAGTLRNKFSHRLDTKLDRRDAKQLLDTLPPESRQRAYSMFKEAGGVVPQGASLTDEGREYFDARMLTVNFFLNLFADVFYERQRAALDKLRSRLGEV